MSLNCHKNNNKRMLALRKQRQGRVIPKKLQMSARLRISKLKKKRVDYEVRVCSSLKIFHGEDVGACQKHQSYL
jgi:hypothetical protein